MDELIRGTDDGLVKALLDEESPFCMPGLTMASSNSISSFIHSNTIYPGPSVEDIETALSYANYGIQDIPHEAKSEENRISLRAERGFTKKDDQENSYRYSLRIKSCGNVVADDGYKWRKYGQKSIKNSPNPRSYYRCTNARCSAKRQVERSIDDPDTLIVTYEGLHFHFDYPFFMLDQQLEMDPPMKKPRGPISETQYQAHYSSALSEERIQQESPEKIHSSPIMESTEMGRQGLLEDMVPLMIRKPLMTNIIAAAASSISSSSCASRESHPSSPASSDSFSWSPDYLFPGFI